MARTLSDEDIEAIAHRVAALVYATRAQTTLTAEELRAKLQCASLSATYRLAAGLFVV